MCTGSEEECILQRKGKATGRANTQVGFSLFSLRFCIPLFERRKQQQLKSDKTQQVFLCICFFRHRHQKKKNVLLCTPPPLWKTGKSAGDKAATTIATTKEPAACVAFLEVTDAPSLTYHELLDSKKKKKGVKGKQAVTFFTSLL
jgi:hypothetical protein